MVSIACCTKVDPYMYPYARADPASRMRVLGFLSPGGLASSLLTRGIKAAGYIRDVPHSMERKRSTMRCSISRVRKALNDGFHMTARVNVKYEVERIPLFSLDTEVTPSGARSSADLRLRCFIRVLGGHDRRGKVRSRTRATSHNSVCSMETWPLSLYGRGAISRER